VESVFVNQEGLLGVWDGVCLMILIGGSVWWVVVDDIF